MAFPANYTEALIRRAFLPSFIAQFLTSHPLQEAFFAHAEFWDGGAPIKQTIATTTEGTATFLTEQGAFGIPPLGHPAIAATYNMKWAVVPVAVGEPELHAASGEFAVVDFLQSKMDLAFKDFQQLISNQLYTGTSDTGVEISGLPVMIDDGTVAGTYAGISRTTYPQWKSVYRSGGGTTAPTRSNVQQTIVSIIKKSGLYPSIAVAGPGTWMKLADDFTPQERYVLGEGGQHTYAAGPQALLVMNVPVVMDPWCPEGNIYFINYDYLHPIVDRKANFEVRSASMLSAGQLADLHVIFVGVEWINRAPYTCGRMANYTYYSL